MKEIEFNSLPDLPKSYFCKTFFWVIDNGLLNVIHGNSVKVLLAISRRANWRSLICNMSNLEISISTGIMKNHISGYIRELRFLKIISVEGSATGRVFKIMEEPPIDLERLTNMLSNYKSNMGRDRNKTHILSNRY